MNEQMDLPVMNEDCSEAKKDARFAISSGVPARFMIALPTNY
jgi:hypothetical protein